MSAFDPSHVDVEHFLDTLGIENITKATQQEMRFSCPFPNHDGGDETPSAYMNLNTSAFFCHGCKERGSAVDFASYVLQISPLEAVKLLRQAYQPGAINPDMRNMQREVKAILERKEETIEQPKLGDDIAARFQMDWAEAWMAWNTKGWESFEPCDYFFERGFEPEWLMDWKFGYDELSGRVVFPVHDEHGNLIGYKGRAHWPNAKPKYLVLGDGPNGGRYGFPRYYPSQVVFGAHRVQETDKLLIVCEGELNAIAVCEKTDYQAVAINGSFFQTWHSKIIRRVAPGVGVVLFLDDDSAGNNAVWGWENSKGEWRPGAIELLSPHLPVRLVHEHTKDAAEMTPAEIIETIESSRSWLLASMGS